MGAGDFFGEIALVADVTAVGHGDGDELRPPAR